MANEIDHVSFYNNNEINSNYNLYSTSSHNIFYVSEVTGSIKTGYKLSNFVQIPGIATATISFGRNLDIQKPKGKEGEYTKDNGRKGLKIQVKILMSYENYVDFCQSEAKKILFEPRVEISGGTKLLPIPKRSNISTVNILTSENLTEIAYQKELKEVEAKNKELLAKGTPKTSNILPIGIFHPIINQLKQSKQNSKSVKASNNLEGFLFHFESGTTSEMKKGQVDLTLSFVEFNQDTKDPQTIAQYNSGSSYAGNTVEEKLPVPIDKASRDSSPAKKTEDSNKPGINSASSPKTDIGISNPVDIDNVDRFGGFNNPSPPRQDEGYHYTINDTGDIIP